MLKCPRCDSEEVITHEYESDKDDETVYVQCASCNLSFTADSEGRIIDFGGESPSNSDEITEYRRQ